MSLILDALKRARQLAQGKRAPSEAQELIKSFGFGKPARKSSFPRLLTYLVPAVAVALAIAGGLWYWQDRRPTISSPIVTAELPAADLSVSPPVPVEAPVPETPAPEATPAPTPEPVPAAPEIEQPKPARRPPVRPVPTPQPHPAVSNPETTALPELPAAAPAATAVEPPVTTAAAPPAPDSIRVEIGNRDPFEMAVFYHQSGDYVRARILYRQILDKNPLDKIALNNLGLLYMATSEHAEAIRAFRNAIIVDANYDRAHNNLGYALMTVGQSSEAEREFQRALLLNSKNAEALINLGILARTAGNSEQSKIYYLKALQLNVSSAEAHYNLAQIYEEQGESGPAIDHYRSFLNFGSSQHSGRVPQVEAKIRELTRPRQP